MNTPNPDSTPTNRPEAQLALIGVAGRCMDSLRRYGAECFPEIVNGQKHFVRVLMESWADGIQEALVPALSDVAKPVEAQSGGEASDDLTVILESIHQAATDQQPDVMTDPTWNLDYSLSFTLTVKQLRTLDAYLSRTADKEVKTT